MNATMAGMTGPSSPESNGYMDPSRFPEGSEPADDIGPTGFPNVDEDGLPLRATEAEDAAAADDDDDDDAESFGFGSDASDSD